MAAVRPAPRVPAGGLPRAELVARYGERDASSCAHDFEEDGLVYNPNPDVVPNSFAALRLTELARDLGRHEEIHDRLMDAYWRDGSTSAIPTSCAVLSARPRRSDDVESRARGRPLR